MIYIIHHFCIISDCLFINRCVIADIRCPQLKSIEHGDAVYKDDNEGATVVFSCKDGYLLQGAKLLKCREGKWSGNVPVCRRECYGSLSHIPNKLHFTEDYVYIYIYIYNRHFNNCHYHHFHHHHYFSINKCLSGIRCDNILNIKNGQVLNVSSGDEHQSVRNFRCNEGYKMVGKDSILCFRGEWAPSVPECKGASGVC